MNAVMYRCALGALVWAGAAAGCDERLADRCRLDRDCDAPQVCSNEGDRKHPGFCVDPPDAAPAEEAV